MYPCYPGCIFLKSNSKFLRKITWEQTSVLCATARNSNSDADSRGISELFYGRYCDDCFQNWRGYELEEFPWLKSEFWKEISWWDLCPIVNSYTIIRSQGVILEDCFPSRLKTRSRRRRELVSRDLAIGLNTFELEEIQMCYLRKVLLFIIHCNWCNFRPKSL